MRTRVTDFSLYRWRYIVSLVGLGLILVLAIYTALFFAPNGLRAGELESSLQSSQLSMTSLEPEMVINLPYHILQRASFLVFDVTQLSIKLPSVILGAATIAGLYMLLRTWTRRNIAVLVSILATLSAPFMFMLQDGTPTIMFTVVSVWLLFAATYVTREKTFGTLWKVMTGVLMATALYVPLGGYIVLAIMTTAFFHPHIRHVIKRFPRVKLILAITLGILALTPLIYASIVDYRIAFTLLGIPTGSIDIIANATRVSLDWFGFGAASDGHYVRPMFMLATSILMVVGAYRLFTQKYTARSYIVIILTILLVPLILLNPEHIFDSFVIGMLLAGLGLATLVAYWYRLFPRNPYARITGLIPLTILVVGLGIAGFIRYTNNYMYNPEITARYSSDLRLLQAQLGETKSSSPVRLIVAKSELPFYDLVAHYDDRFYTTIDPSLKEEVSIMTHDAFRMDGPEQTAARIITDRQAEHSDRFYLYQRDAK